LPIANCPLAPMPTFAQINNPQMDVAFIKKR
jgi:hypothetical protein